MGLSLKTLVPLQFRLWLGRFLFRPLGPLMVRVSRHRVIKGPFNPPEVGALQYVVEHTTIPVPKVYAIHTWKQRMYIEIEYMS